ncbi:MAG: LacI family DNA-binding transcriptional regulator [Bacteroidales bacterium]|nr:LacI family DNA-binding transcriptional regulator [Bacteroidales bacterium]
MPKPTITDIAKALDITASTVSRALAGSPKVSQATRMLVERKAAEMGYERNVLASSLRRGVTDTVGMVVPRVNRQFFSNIISGAEAVLNPAGYNLIISQSHEHSEDERRAIQTLLRNQVSGILISHSIETKDAEAFKDMLASTGVTVIQFDRAFEGIGDLCVVNDNFECARSATRHLIESGYERIGYMGGDESSNVYVDRKAGYMAAMREAGLEVNDDYMFSNCITRDKGFYNAAKAVERGCGALYCAGDYAALGVIEYARDKGIKIPEDFGVVGTANENFTDVVYPSLSSVEQNSTEMGTAVAKAFLDIKSGKALNTDKIIIPTRLIVRDSSKRRKY